MKIAFGEFSGWDFHAGSVESTPLGGSSSAASYLAQALVQRGHEVWFFTLTTAPGLHAGVQCRSWAETSVESLRSLGLDVFVGILSAGNGVPLRNALDPATRLILWTQHRCDQQSVQLLGQSSEQQSYDAFVFVSEWQRQEFLRQFSIDPDRSVVLRNAIAPAFQDLFPDAGSVEPHKATPPILAYTSTPFRGLDLLLEAFPAIRAAFPEARLRVFSGMQVYRVAPDQEQAEYGALYQRCRETPGVEYLGSVAQPVLARELRAVRVFAYPNCFPETSCISVLEAMSAGCRIVTSDLGALRETSAGFARLVPIPGTRADYLSAFVRNTVEALTESTSGLAVAEEFMRRQIDYVRQNATWAIRAGQWEEWLGSRAAVPPCAEIP